MWCLEKRRDKIHLSVKNDFVQDERNVYVFRVLNTVRKDRRRPGVEFSVFFFSTGLSKRMGPLRTFVEKEV